MLLENTSLRKFRQTFVCLGFKFKTYVAAMFESFSLIFPYWTSRGSRTALNSFSILCESHNEAGFATKGISEIKQKEFSGAIYLVRGSGNLAPSRLLIYEIVPGALKWFKDAPSQCMHCVHNMREVGSPEFHKPLFFFSKYKMHRL